MLLGTAGTQTEGSTDMRVSVLGLGSHWMYCEALSPLKECQLLLVSLLTRQSLEQTWVGVSGGGKCIRLALF